MFPAGSSLIFSQLYHLLPHPSIFACFSIRPEFTLFVELQGGLYYPEVVNSKYQYLFQETPCMLTLDLVNRVLNIQTQVYTILTHTGVILLGRGLFKPYFLPTIHSFVLLFIHLFLPEMYLITILIFILSLSHFK